jgi:hypothetical protein
MSKNAGSPNHPPRAGGANKHRSHRSPEELSTFWQNLINKNHKSSLPQDDTGEIATHALSEKFSRADDRFREGSKEPHTAEVETFISSVQSCPEENTDWRIFLRERRMMSRKARSSTQGWEGASENFENKLEMQRQFQEPRPEVIAAIQETFQSKELDKYLDRKANQKDRRRHSSHP